MLTELVKDAFRFHNNSCHVLNICYVHDTENHFVFIPTSILGYKY